MRRKNFMKDYLSITEMAKLRDLTTETLRHYDRIGLFKPEYVDPITNYRYYSSAQFEILGTIKELRQLGMSLDDIAEYFNDRNLEKSTRILKEQHELLKKEIKEKTVLEKTLRRKLSFINKINAIQKVGVPTFKVMPQRFMITHGKLYRDSRQIVMGQTELEKYLSVKAPVLATDRMAYYTTENIFAAPYGKVFGIAPMIFCDPEEIKKSMEIHLIPSGRYACIYYNGSIYPDKENFDKLKKFISDNGCTVSGNIYIQHIIDVTLTSRPSEKMIEMQVPVE